MKQKSLMSFFGKKDDTKSTPAGKTKVGATPKTVKSTPRNVEKENPPSSPVTEHRTPLPKANSQSSGIVSATYTRSSDGGKSAFDTPPTSDPIDVDMVSEMEASDAIQSSAAKSVSVTALAHIATSLTGVMHRTLLVTSARSCWTIQMTTFRRAMLFLTRERPSEPRKLVCLRSSLTLRKTKRTCRSSTHSPSVSQNTRYLLLSRSPEVRSLSC